MRVLVGRTGASGQFSLSIGNPATYERSDLALMLDGRGPHSLHSPIHFPSARVNFILPTVKWAGRQCEGEERMIDQTRQAEDRKRLTPEPTRSFFCRLRFWVVFLFCWRMMQMSPKVFILNDRYFNAATCKVFPIRPQISHLCSRPFHSISGLGQNQMLGQKWLRHPIFPECDRVFRE